MRLKGAEINANSSEAILKKLEHVYEAWLRNCLYLNNAPHNFIVYSLNFFILFGKTWKKASSSGYYAEKD